MGDKPADAGSNRATAFGPFRLRPSQRLLLKGDEPVAIGSRALALLIALVERAGDVVGKDELVSRVWPDTFVEEGNLRVHVAALRRALGDGQAAAHYIATVPGRGYSFVAAVAAIPEATTAPARQVPPQDTRRLARIAHIVGRDDVIDSIVTQMPQRRFTTIVGPGGIGKTTVALAAAEQLSQEYADGVRLVDLVPGISDPRNVA